ncbi:MAG: DUF4159 domain-containing protein [Rhizobiaceae bacterium]|nr:DUF4159 domain-containing protein [Rhizobiaceae bacterium]
MFGLPIAFASPLLLTALLSLPVIWWLLRLTPPRPQQEVFPPTRILARLKEKEETPAQSPWWLTLLRLTMAALAIIAMAGPILNPQQSTLAGDGPVLLIIDDGWASADEWETRLNTANAIVADAKEAGRSVALFSTTERPGWEGEPTAPEQAEEQLLAAQARPLEPDHVLTAERITAVLGDRGFTDIAFLSDGLERDGTSELNSVLNGDNSNVNVFNTETGALYAIEKVANEPRQMIGTLIRTEQSTAAEVDLSAKDEKGLTIAQIRARFEAGSSRAEFVLDEPVELRNQIARLETTANRNAASVQLLDESNRRRLVGLISGEAFDQSQPLLSPLYYIARALEPFSDIRRADDANVTASVPDLVNQGVNTIILADVGTISEAATNRLKEWVEGGGLLIRFSGPRLGAAPTRDLLPVDIRPGDRRLGGALSWETPKPLAPFEPDSPFFGLEAPREVLVSKQLLALQEANLQSKTWAVLEDGTPLVTADKRGAGWIVLFHVGSDTQWSNLPLSGTFVEMLRRTVNLSRSGPTNVAAGEEIVLPPLRLLDGQGSFTEPGPSSKPLVLKQASEESVTVENPPGLYGTTDGFVALNLFEEETELKALDLASTFPQASAQTYIKGARFEFKNWLLLAAGFLLLLDCLAVLWMAGTLKSLTRGRAASTAMITMAFGTMVFAATTDPAQAQESEIDFSSALETRLAYVVTGIQEVDEISEAGLRGLTLYISSRTALEPGQPIGIDIADDELAFYSLLYWPVDPRAELPSAEAMARIDAFMKEGGSVLFDTRDQISGVLGGTSSSPAAIALQQILSGLDVPALEPVPEDHVLTKSFYLLDTFPGRYAGGDLWVQVSENSEEQEGRPALVGDGVSSILITSNDFAGAWAVDNDLSPLLPTIPPDPAQRNYAFRSGVNLMMYALTGNYKSDQVHLPALLERLGQ